MGCYGAITQLPANNGYEIVDPNYVVQHRGNWRDNYVTVCGKERRDYFSYRIVGFFLSKGLTLNEACAIAGNASCEGGFCGGAQNWMKDGSGESFGMFAFYNGGVFPTFKAWCDKNNRKYWFIDSILDFLWYFISNGVTSQGKQLKDFFLSDTGKNATIEECSLKWACIFERCGAKKLPNGGYTYACCDSKKGRNPERAKSSREIKSKVLEYKYFSQNGDCTSTEITSNMDTSGTSSGTWSGLSIDTSNMSETCKRLMNGLSSLMGGYVSGGTGTQVTLPDINLPAGSDAQTVADSNNSGTPILFGDSWAFQMNRFGTFSAKTGGISNEADSGGTTRNGIRVKKTTFKKLEGLLSRVQKYNLKERKPKFILCHIGYNDITLDSTKTSEPYNDITNNTSQQNAFRSDLTELVNAFQGYRTYMIAIPKTNQSCSNGINNRVATANQILKECCKGTVKYITYDAETTNTLREKYMDNCNKQSRDNSGKFHLLTREGNEYYLGKIREKIKQVDNGFDIYNGNTVGNKTKKK